MLDKTLVSVPVGGGVDTRTAADRVQPPKLAALENASFRRPGAYEQRYGFARRATTTTNPRSNPLSLQLGIVGARGLVPVGDGLHLVSSGGERRQLRASGWADDVPDFGGVKVDLEPIGVSYLNIGAEVAETASDAVSFNGETFVAIEVNGRIDVWKYDAHGQLLSSLYSTSGTITNATKPRMVATTGGPVLFCLGDTNSLFCTALEPFVFPVTVATDVHATDRVYDAASIAERAYVAWNTSTANTLKHAVLSGRGDVIVSAVTQATADAPVAMTVTTDATNYYAAIAWASDGDTSAYGRAFDAATLSGLAATSTLTALLLDDCENIGATFAESLFFAHPVVHVYIETAGATPDMATVIGQAFDPVTGSAAGLGVGELITYRHSGLGSKPWSPSRGESAVMLVHDSDEQAGYIIGGALFGRTVSLTGGGDRPTKVFGSLFMGDGLGLVTTKHLPAAQALGDDQFLVALRWKPLATSGAYANVVTLDYDSTIDAVQAGGAAFIPGAFVWELDGAEAYEAEFVLFPEGGPGVGASPGGGLLPATTYSYLCFFEHTDANGIRRVSTAADVITVTTGGGDDAVTLTLSTLDATNRAKVVYAIYRREQEGDLYHRVSSGDLSAATGTNGLLIANAASDTVTFTDGMAEADLLEQELAPGTGGILDNVAPPSCTIIAAGNGRVFLSGFQDENLIRYSKTRDTMEPLNFNDALELVVEHGRGPITALGTFQDSLAIFRETQVYVSGGEGLDNAGATGGFTTPRLLSDDVGCPFPRSICQIPGALLFQSRKGFYSFGGNGLEYVGADVERLTADVECLAAVVVADAHEARFVMSDGTTLVYDYTVGAWNAWSVGGIDARLVDNVHVILKDADGVLLEESAGTYLDDGQPYSLAIQWPQLHAAGLQGAQRIYRILFAGEFLGEHQALVRLAFDRGPFGEQQTWDPSQVIGVASARYGAAAYGSGRFGGEVDASTPSVAASAYQFQVKPRRQKCQTIAIRLEAQARPGGGVLQASFAISDLALQVGVRPGAPRLGTGKTAT